VVRAGGQRTLILFSTNCVCHPGHQSILVDDELTHPRTHAHRPLSCLRVPCAPSACHLALVTIFHKHAHTHAHAHRPLSCLCVPFAPSARYLTLVAFFHKHAHMHAHAHRLLPCVCVPCAPSARYLILVSLS